MIKQEIRLLMESMIRSIPGYLGIKIRRHYYRGRLKKCGEGTIISEFIFFDRPDRISLGDRVGIGRFCSFSGAFGIEIDDDVLIGPYTMVESVDHVRKDLEIPISQQGYCGSTVHIGKGSWIGAGVLILSGVTIGENCIVGAGAVVTRDVTPRTVVAGIPAKEIGRR
jgi:acetyltransferase-like isoleucine patch superfamily enzyme